MKRTVAGLMVLFMVAVLAGGLRAELTPEQSKEAQALIAQFASPEYAVREGAMKKLIEMGPDTLPMVRKALGETKDAEVKVRCQVVINAFEVRVGGRVLFAIEDVAMMVVEKEGSGYGIEPKEYRQIFVAMRTRQEVTMQPNVLGRIDWSRPETDPKLVVTLKSGARPEVLMWVKRSPQFMIRKEFAGEDVCFDCPALATLIDKTIQDGLVVKLGGKQWTEERVAAARQLWDMGNPAGEAILRETLKADKPEKLRMQAAVRLGGSQDPEAFNALLDIALTTTNASYGQQACNVLSKYAGHGEQTVANVLKKISLEGKFEKRDQAVMANLVAIGTNEATQVLIEMWGAGHYPGMGLTLLAGNYFKEDQYAECLAWWEANKQRPHVKLLADGVANDPEGYGSYCVTEMKRLDAKGGIEELMERLPKAKDIQLRRMMWGLATLSGEKLGDDKYVWLRWWKWKKEGEKPGERPEGDGEAFKGADEAAKTFCQAIMGQKTVTLKKMAMISEPDWTADRWRKECERLRSVALHQSERRDMTVRGNLAAVQWHGPGKAKADLVLVLQLVPEQGWLARSFGPCAPDVDLSDFLEGMAKEHNHE